jgi:hypothetical protein
MTTRSTRCAAIHGADLSSAGRRLAVTNRLPAVAHALAHFESVVKRRLTTRHESQELETRALG